MYLSRQVTKLVKDTLTFPFLRHRNPQAVIFLNQTSFHVKTKETQTNKSFTDHNYYMLLAIVFSTIDITGDTFDVSLQEEGNYIYRK